MPEDDLTTPEAPPPRPPPGRTLTERVDEALNQILHGEKVGLIISKLNETERRLFEELVAKARLGELGTLQDLWRVDYVRQPPTIQEFVEDLYWLGGTLRPGKKELGEENPGLFPGWKEIFIGDFDLDSRIHNAEIGRAHV